MSEFDNGAQGNTMDPVTPDDGGEAVSAGTSQLRQAR